MSSRARPGLIQAIVTMALLVLAAHTPCTEQLQHRSGGVDRALMSVLHKQNRVLRAENSRLRDMCGRCSMVQHTAGERPNSGEAVSEARLDEVAPAKNASLGAPVSLGREVNSSVVAENSSVRNSDEWAMNKVREAYMAMLGRREPKTRAWAEKVGYNKKFNYCNWFGVICGRNDGSRVVHIRFKTGIDQGVINILSLLPKLKTFRIGGSRVINLTGLDFRPMRRLKLFMIFAEVIQGRDLFIPASIVALQLAAKEWSDIHIDWRSIPKLRTCKLMGVSGPNTLQGIEASTLIKLSMSLFRSVKLPRLPSSLLDLRFSRLPKSEETVTVVRAGMDWRDLRKLDRLVITGVKMTDGFWDEFNSTRVTSLSVYLPKGMSSLLGSTLPSGVAAVSSGMRLFNWGFAEPSEMVMPLLPSAADLEKLGLYGFNMARWPGNIDKAARLRKATFKRCNITEIPEGVTSLGSLEKLDLSDNSIRNISSAVSDFVAKNAIELNTAGNPYVDPARPIVTALAQKLEKALKVNMGGVHTTRDLCERLSLMEYIKVICDKSHRITTFSIPGKLLGEVPEELAHYASSLVNLDLQGNGITHFPQELAHSLVNLKYLGLRSNMLVSPPDVSKMVNLHKLMLGDNRIKDVSSLHFASQALSVIDIESNSIKEIPAAWFTFVSLKRIYASHNQLVRIPLGWKSMESLEYFDISHNMLTDSTLHFIRSPAYSHNLEFLASHNPGITQFPGIARIRAFKRIDLSYCNIVNIPDDAFDGTFSMDAEIYLQGNEIKTFPTKLIKGQSFERLHLGENNLTSIDVDALAFSNIQVLNMTRNRIETASHLRVTHDQSISFRKALKKTRARLGPLDLSFNRMRSIPLGLADVARILDLDGLNLMGNDLRDFTNFPRLQGSRVSFSDYSLRYINPKVPELENKEVLKLLRSGNEMDVALETFPKLADKIRTLNNDTLGSVVGYSAYHDVHVADPMQGCDGWGVSNQGNLIQIVTCYCEDGFYRDLVDLNRCRPCPDMAVCKYDSLMCNKGSHGVLIQEPVGDDEPNMLCKVCPEGAVCDGVTVVPKKGYWKGSVDSSEVHSCSNPAACQGGKDSVCSPGYRGVICGECDRGYFAESAHTCAKCPDPTVSIAFFVLACLGIVAAGVGFFVVASSVLQNRYSKEAKQEQRVRQLKSMMNELRAEMSTSLKVSIGFLQVITSLDLTFDVDWPSAINIIDGIFGWVNLDIMRATSVECVWELVSLGGMTGDSDTLETSGFGYAQQMMLTCLFPLAVSAILFAVYWMVQGFLCIRLVRRNTKLNVAAFKNSCTQCNLLAWQLCYLPLSYRAIQYFNCVSFDGGATYYIHYDLSTVCYDSSYWRYSSAAFATIAVYTIGMPLFIVVYGYMRNSDIHDESKVGPLVYLYKPYKKQYAFWEGIELIRKMIVGGAVVLLSGSPTFQVTVALGVMFAFTVAYCWCLPNSSKTACAIQGVMLSLTYFTMSLGLLRALEVPSEHRDVFSFVVIGLNILVVAMVLAMLLYEGMNIAAEELTALVKKVRAPIQKWRNNRSKAMATQG